MWKVYCSFKSDHQNAGTYITNVLAGLGITPINENRYPDRYIWVCVPLADAPFIAWTMLRHADTKHVWIEEVKY